MNTIRSIPAFYPLFELGGSPQSIPCSLSIVESNGKKFLKTPFAMLDAYGDDDPEMQIKNGHYYATAAECEAYLSRTYPNWKIAAPLMDKMCDCRRLYGYLVGSSRVADMLDSSDLDGSVYRLIRGHSSVPEKTVKRALRLLKNYGDKI